MATTFFAALVLAFVFWVQAASLPLELLDDVACAIQMSMRAQAAISECDDDHVKIPEDRYVLTNNLGGHGPSTGPPVIHISPMMVDTISNRSLDLIISNLTQYSPANSTRNGFFFGDLLSINIVAGFVDLLFTFKETSTGNDVTMPPFNLTIYDIDGPVGKEDAETVTMASADVLNYMVTVTTQVSVTEHTGALDFQSTSHGSKCDNPSSMENLGIIQCNDEMVDQFSRAVAVQMRGGVNSYQITLRVRDDVHKGRNFFFGLPVYFERLCRSGPTGAPTPYPTMHPTVHPTASPTTIPPPTTKPMPTPSPTAEPPSTPLTTAKTTSAPPSITASTTPTPPTASPTASPTRARPTFFPPHNSTNDFATAFGDPHVGNVRGDSFEILQPGYHNFLVIPRGSHDSGSLLHVRAKVEPLGHLCGGLLYVTTLVFKGKWLGAVKALEFSTNITGDMDANSAIKIKAGGSAQPYLNVSQFVQQINWTMVDVAVLRPAQEPKVLNKHVTTLLVKLRLGPSVTRVRMVYQKEKGGFSNSLWLTATGLRRVEREIGGILGLDDHTKAAKRPKQCNADTMRTDARQSRIHAWSSLDDIDEN